MNNVDAIRLEEFRQFRKEIRGSAEYLVVGIDVAKEKHHAFFGTATGKALVRKLVFANNIEGFEGLLEQEEALKVRYGLDKVVYGFEPTGNYHKPLGEHLVKCGRVVATVSGEAAKENRKTLDGRWDKNDTKDSANVADLVSRGRCMFYDHPWGPLADLRRLLSLKRRLKRLEHGFMVRIRNGLVAQYFPELDRYWGKREKEGMALVRWCLDPCVIAGMEFEQFVGTVTSRDGGKAQRQWLEAVWKAAVDSVGCEAGEAVAFEARVTVEGLRRIREDLGETQEEVERVCLGFPEYEFLLTIPGFGPDVSAKVLGAIGDPFRFENATQVVKLAGFDLSAKRSGKRSDWATPVISKKGKAELRCAVYHAAMVASSRNRHFLRYFTEKLRGREREKGIGTKMRVKLGAKLLVIAWTLMKKKEPFDPRYLNR